MKNKMFRHSAFSAAGVSACRAIYFSFFILHFLFLSCSDDVHYSSDPNLGLRFTADTIAYALNQGDTETEEALKDILSGEGKRDLSNQILRGIIYSSNAEMHEYLCKLLCAARLQEGLRQAICECADAGTAAAFRAILHTIEKENLIRFSSVKRAVGTWTGLLAPDSGDLSRISDKTLAQMTAVLDSPGTRERYLQSEDSTEIYMALWGYGFYEISDAAEKINEIAAHGSHHQLLTAGYFLANINNAKYTHQIAKQIILTHSTEQDIMAVTLPHLMSDWHSAVYRYGIQKYSSEKEALRSKQYFTGDQEAKQFWQILAGLLDALPKKDPVFSPCVFPWFSAELSRKTILSRMALIAGILDDPDDIDTVVSMLPQFDATQRVMFIRILLRHPQTKAQRRALTEAICDKETYTRKEAFELTAKNPILPEQYRMMENMLRYKAADARENLICLLLKQPDDMLFESITRLLADPKEEKRTAALDLIMQVCGDENRSALARKCRDAASALESPSGKEQILLSQILGSEKAVTAKEKAPLFTDADVYCPVLTESDYLRESIAVFKRYFPDTQIYSEKKGLLRKLKDAVSKQTECASYQETVRMLHLIEAMLIGWKKREFTYCGITHTVDCISYQFYELDENRKRRVAFYKDWEKRIRLYTGNAGTHVYCD